MLGFVEFESQKNKNLTIDYARIYTCLGDEYYA
jgi:hypothetical protein